MMAVRDVPGRSIPSMESRHPESGTTGLKQFLVAAHYSTSVRNPSAMSAMIQLYRKAADGVQ